MIIAVDYGILSLLLLRDFNLLLRCGSDNGLTAPIVSVGMTQSRLIK